MLTVLDPFFFWTSWVLIFPHLFYDTKFHLAYDGNFEYLVVKGKTPKGSWEALQRKVSQWVTLKWFATDCTFTWTFINIMQYLGYLKKNQTSLEATMGC